MGTDLDGLWTDRDDPSFSAHRSPEDSLKKPIQVVCGFRRGCAQVEIKSDAKSGQPPPLAFSEARVVGCRA